MDNRESRVSALLQKAIYHGKLDWVQSLLRKASRIGVVKAHAALYLAREMSEKYPSDAHRLAIKAVLEATNARERKDSCGEESKCGVEGLEAPEGCLVEETHIPYPMDLPWLERILGVKLGLCRWIEYPARFQRFKKMLDEDLSGLLIKAVENNAIDCVDLLLRCGADVNASRFIKGKSQRAIDIAVSRNYRSIVKLLLERDTIIPDLDRYEIMEFLTSVAKEFGSIEELFKKRDDFHEKVKKGDIAGVTDVLSGKDVPSGPRYWIDREGNSALYVALIQGKEEVYALLKSRNFEFLDWEKRKLEIILKGRHRDLDSVLGKQFEALKNRHLLKMSLITLLRKGEEYKERGIVAQDIYEAADKVPEARLLMQCLQYDHDLQVVFDLSRKDITCLCSRSTSGVQGMIDQELNRIYVSGALDEWSDTVSNLVHEMAHAVLNIIFKNGGLPYMEGDEDKKLKYKEIASAILCKENIEQCNEIIRRIVGYPKEDHPYELIVRIPEIITKLIIEGKYPENGEPWRNDNEKTLFHFYRNFVETGITSWIKKKASENPFSSLTRHQQEFVEINTLEMPETKYSEHNGIRYLQVSNLELGVSHLKASVKDVVVVDWKKMLEIRKTLDINLRRRYIDTLAVVLDDGMAASFCSNSRKCNEDCPAFVFSQIKDYIILIVPESFFATKGNNPVEYKWEHLSNRTKEWILDGKVIFQGQVVNLREMIGFVANKIEVESTLNSITDPGVIAWIVQGKIVTCGSELKAFREMRRDEFSRYYPEILYERKMMMRPIKLDEDFLRKTGAVFIFNAKESDVMELNLGEISKWNIEKVPDEIRVFLLEGNLSSVSECDRICEEVLSLGKDWHYVHFFKCIEGRFFHVHSKYISRKNRQLLASVPGSGKTIFVHCRAKEEKEMFPETWVEVIELSKREDILASWDEVNGNVEDFLYDLISKDGCIEIRRMNLERNLFKLFCQSRGKVSIYFDAFDEICPKFKEKFSSFLGMLLEKLDISVFVTTRTNEAVDLEKILSVIGKNLAPFDDKQQISYLNDMWNAMLHTVEPLKRVDKLNAIILNLRAHYVSEKNFYLAITNLKHHSANPSVKVDFREVAEEVINMFEPSGKNEGYPSEIPLHAWMMASVYFENNFDFSSSLRMSFLYTRLVEAKLKDYCYGKAKLKGSQVEDGVMRSAKKNMRQNLKKYSAFLFLEKKKYKPIEEDLLDLLRAGLLVKKGIHFDFIHRTFREFFFSSWLLEEAANPVVTNLFLKTVMWAEECKTMRQFIDELLLSSGQMSSTRDEEKVCEINLLNISACGDGEVSGDLIRTCLVSAVVYYHSGILKYLLDSLKERLPDVLFGILDLNGGDITWEPSTWKELINFKDHPELEYRDLKIVKTVLIVTEEKFQLNKLRDFISEYGLKWAGVNEDRLWEVGESRDFLLWFTKFLIRHKRILGHVLEDKILGEDYKGFFLNFFHYSFAEWTCFLESMWGKCFEKLLDPSPGSSHSRHYSPIVSVWTHTVTKESEYRIKELWDFVKSKLKTSDGRKEFLRKEDTFGFNCLSWFLIKTRKFELSNLVWEVIMKEFSGAELKEYIFASYGESAINSFIFDYIKVKDALDWLNYVVKNGVFNLKDSIVFLRRIRTNGFTSHGWLFVQEFLAVAGEDASARAEIKDFLANLGAFCPVKRQDISYHPEVHLLIQKDWERILESLSPHLPECSIPVDDKGYIMESIWRTEEVEGFMEIEALVLRIHVRKLVTCLVLSWRQLELITKYVADSDLPHSIPKNCFNEIFYAANTYGLMSIPYFFSVLTAFFSKKQIYDSFVESKFLQNVVEIDTEDIHFAQQFLRAYDVARLSLGEDAIWMVHSIQEKLLEVLNKMQDEGVFQTYFSRLKEHQNRCPPNHLVHLRTYSLDDWRQIEKTYALEEGYVQSLFKELDQETIIDCANPMWWMLY